MPAYEYLCESCGYKFEKFQNINDEPLKECPECGGKVKRLISKDLGVILKREEYYKKGSEDEISSGKTCCGRTERCETPPCSSDGKCRR
jgi:putative FmdB family regulatory protein